MLYHCRLDQLSDRRIAFRQCIYYIFEKGTMIAKVQKWGNSLAVRIPKPLAKEAHLSNDAEVELSVQRGKLTVARARPRRYRLADLLAEVRTSNLHDEVSFGGPVGRERL